MRRVRSSIHGVCAGAGQTVALELDSPAAESRFGRRRRSSMVFTPCPPETPTRSNSFLKLQRADSSLSSASGWDNFSSVGEDDDVQGLLTASGSASKVTQNCSFSPGRSRNGLENCSYGDDANLRNRAAAENVSSFVACWSPPVCRAAPCSSFPELTTSAAPLPHLPQLKSHTSCSSTTGCYMPAIITRNYGEGARGGSSRPLLGARAGNWLGAALAADELEALPCGGGIAGEPPSSDRRRLQREDLCAVTVPPACVVGGAMAQAQTPSCLHRTRRVVRDMYQMAEMAQGFGAN